MPSRSRSLRFKLTLWFVLVFFVIQTTLASGVVLLRREVIQRSRDDGLMVSVEEMIESILAAEAGLNDAELEALVPASAGFLMYSVRDESGAVLASSNVPAGHELPFSSWEAVPAGKLGPVFTTMGPERAREFAADDALRLVTVPFRYRDRSYFFQAAVLDRLFLGPFFDLIVIGGPVGIIAAMIAAWIIAGRAVSPMDQLSRAAKDVSPTSLDKRFRVPTTDHEVTRLEQELNSALERLEAGYRAQDQFISNVSHELKTPIAVLLTEAQVAKIGGRSGERAGEKARAFIDHVESEMKRLGKLVESLLTLARADILRDRPLEAVSVNDIVLQSVQHCTLLANQNRTHLIPNLAEPDGREPVVEGDAALLQTMLDNLVRNAIAQSPADGHVAIDARCSGDTLEITVSDHGPGIPDDYLDKIFDRFVQVPTGTNGRGGMGLGLTIASGVAELHHGSIVARNNADRGCSFIVTLPLYRSASSVPLTAR
jgi:signal transduction histidine kinase